MFGLFRKNCILESGVLDGMKDVHSHIIYGVDDGSKNIQMSNGMLESLSNMGIKGAFCTPHIKSDLTNNNPDSLRLAFDKFKSEVSNSKIELRLAAEYMIDEAFMPQIERHDLLTYDDRHVLVEMSYLAPPRNKEQAFFELQVNGYLPVLAHPERYLKFENLRSLSKLKDKGCKFQFNLASLSGAYGESVKKFSQDLMNAGLYDFIGTDIHNPLLFFFIQNIKCTKKLESQIRKLVENNEKLWVNQ